MTWSLVADSLGITVTVIDGATNIITPVLVGFNPVSLAVNPITNKIYVASLSTNAVTVMDGVTLTNTTIAVGTNPVSIAVKPVTNQAYVAKQWQQQGHSD